MKNRSNFKRKDRKNSQVENWGQWNTMADIIYRTSKCDFLTQYLERFSTLFTGLFSAIITIDMK